MAEEHGTTGYDKYVNWKLFFIPVIIFFIVLAIPTPYGMKDVGTEVKVGPKAVVDSITRWLFEKSSSEVEQWQLLTAQMMERNMRMGTLTKGAFLKKDMRWAQKYSISADSVNFKKMRDFVQSMSDETFHETMKRALKLRQTDLLYENLSPTDKKTAEKGAWNIKVAVGMIVIVVFCFITECVPLPTVSFLMGLILVFTGVLGREEAPALYWSDSVWFIMGSLMFSAAFVKTGVDKRICLMMFRKLAAPNVKMITLVLFIVIAPLSSFVSDHALAAMFLPVGILLYQNSLNEQIPEDKELAKMLMISIAMAANVGGPGAPSGGARNVIMMGYLNDMFGIDIGFFQWMTYCYPFVFIMIPLTWFLINWRFKPKITSVAPAMKYLQAQVERMGGWNRKQVTAIIIFLIMLIGWLTEKDLYDAGIIPFRLGVGILAVGGGVAFLLAGVVNWRSYQEIDWGVVWLYAGAIIFGRTLDSTGAAYWLARTIVDGLEPLGLSQGLPLLMTGSTITALITNLMADGPAAAAVGPVTMSLAGLAHPGTTFVPFMAMATAMSASFAFCLIIGTPPNAIVYASGYLDAKDFLRVGVILWVAALLIVALLAGAYWSLRGFGALPFY
ncbi:MAG: DASS family sodium-coupled anion symporter [Desulfobacteraceae bacterium]|nr:MAG: DASS family sodium-coupled anion symporter [Desulfobacteraceae bacterium]